MGERGEAMSENEGLLVARVTIERRMTGDDIVDYVTTEDVNGEDLPVTEALGMMRMAEHTLLTPEDDEGDEGW
jgi:hypothetical protein